MECFKMNDCKNYGIKCFECCATSDIYDHYPCYSPKDLEQVVRCKDCKYYNLYRLECHNRYMNGIIGMDGFCSYGERK